MFAVPIDPRLPAPPPADKSPLQETVAPPVTTENLDLGEKYCLFFNVGLVVASFFLGNMPNLLLAFVVVIVTKSGVHQ